MEHKLYGFNSSQDVINLQTKYSLFARVSNIVFATVVDDGFDRELMTVAINKLFERNDCLRITFLKKDKKIMQYFEESRTIGKIREYVFETAAQQDSFVRSFRRRALNCFKGETLKAVYAVNPDGKDMILFKVSHYVADQYGIGVLVNDLFSVYEALKNGSELPPAPGSFEEVLKKDLEYKDNSEAVEKDKAFFHEYYEGKEHPVYCGIHGNNSERWHKLKKKGNFSLPYLFVKCDTTGYKLTIPAALSEKAFAWCEENKITPSAFFFNAFCITASLVNNKEKIQAPLMLLDCRGTMAERKAAGTKVQSLSIYVKIDYDKSFNENIAEEYAAQNQLFRHTKLTYLEVEALQHKLWGHSMLSQITNFCYSFIPFSTPKGVTMQVLSNGKGALATYVALMLDVNTNVISVVYDIQDKMTTAGQLMEFHNAYLQTIEAVLNRPTEKLSDIL